MFYFLNLYSNREYSRKKTIVFNSFNSFNSSLFELFFIKVPTGTVEAVCTNSLLW